MNRVPVILDTDPGNDIDDALAIAYLLCQKNCELVGITTVTGDVQKRAAIAEVLCQAANRPEVPIVCGKSLSVQETLSQPGCNHYEAIQHLPHSLSRPPEQAVDFIWNELQKRPGEITLVSIGPYTNIAQLVNKYPNAPKFVKSFISMAGAFWGHDNKEWNCICDPLASAIVTDIEWPQRKWFGLDVTMQCLMAKDGFDALCTSQLMKVVQMMATTWFEHSERIVWHDPLAVATIFETGLCGFAEGKVLANRIDGSTHFKPGFGSAQVANQVNAEQFFIHYREVVTSV